MTGPAVVSWRAHEPVRLALAGLAAGELIADKLPGTPPRTSLPPLTFRILSGGFCGRRTALALDADPTLGTVFGAAGAVAGSFAGMILRARIVKLTGIPDPIVALVEDAVAVATAAAATRNSV